MHTLGVILYTDPHIACMLHADFDYDLTFNSCVYGPTKLGSGTRHHHIIINAMQHGKQQQLIVLNGIKGR